MKILITGIKQGLGRYLALEFKKQNYANSIIGVDKISKKELKREISDIIDQYYEVDLSDIDSSLNTFNNIIKKNKNIDVVINNAGIKLFDNFKKLNQYDIINAFRVNTVLPVLINQLFLNELEYIRIINISSNAGFQGYPTGSVYCSSKAALIKFTEAISKETGSNQYVYTLCPSTIATKEYLKQFPEKNNSKLIAPEKVFSKIIKLIDGNAKSRVVPMISHKDKIKYILYDLITFFE